MAHEFNNPLGIIMGFVEDMLSGMAPADPNYRALQIIDEESKRCRQIVRDLMEYARPRSTDFCSTSIADAIEKRFSWWRTVSTSRKSLWRKS